MNEKYTEIPARLHAVTTDGVVAGADEIYDEQRQKKQQDINDELYNTQKRAEQAISEAEYYNELTRAAISSLETNEQEALEYAQAVVKHGRAIERIAAQLGATYDDASREEEGEYTPGFIFETLEEDEMEYLIDNPSEAAEGHIYMQLEPLNEEED